LQHYFFFKGAGEMRIRDRKRWLALVLIVLAAFSFLLYTGVKIFSVVAHEFIEWIVSDMQKENIVKILMPNHYAVYKISVDKRAVVHENGKMLILTQT
jgi:hypothetical protein